MSTSLWNAALLSVVMFSLLSMFLLVQHELHVSSKSSTPGLMASIGHRKETVELVQIGGEKGEASKDDETRSNIHEDLKRLKREEEISKHREGGTEHHAPKVVQGRTEEEKEEDVGDPEKESESHSTKNLEASTVIDHPSSIINHETIFSSNEQERRGKLVCDGKEIDSEVIYWKIVPGDDTYESPITPHHDLHHDRYITFEYDQGGWNNVRMGMEILIVMAHAMGRTLVLPPAQHLYLLGKTHKDKHDKEEHDEMGFEDFFDVELLQSQKGFHTMHMKEFLEKEGVTGGLHGILPPHNRSDIWGNALWSYLNKVADAQPTWYGRFLAMPDRPENFNLTGEHKDPKTVERMKRFGGERSPVFYDKVLQEGHHLHFPAREEHRLLQHHYAFTFFADREMQSFYKRFIRDYMRYRDRIHCAGHELVSAIRADSLKEDPNGNGVYYALHIRRGDFQFKEVKVSAEQIVKNLHFPNGTAIIPPGSLVYLSTDDPDGVCANCFVQRQPCDNYKVPKPPGCPDDPSWEGMRRAGWKLRFLNDYLKQGILKDFNPNLYGTAEVIVCSRAKVFAGTFYSTFTGYIHRIRGYHGIGEDSYYHTNNLLMALRKPESMGHGFFREWRAGWTDDTNGELI